jgi:hypothetical protein
MLKAHIYLAMVERMKKGNTDDLRIDLEGFDREMYEASNVQLTRHLAKLGWEFGDCVVEEDNNVL